MNIHIKLENDFADREAIERCVGWMVRLLGEQHMSPTAANYIVLCDHFLSQLSLSLCDRDAFNKLRLAMMRVLNQVTVTLEWAPPPVPQEVLDQRAQERITKLAELFKKK